jgi:hypothetical protein
VQARLGEKMKQSFIDEQLSKRNKRLAAVLATIFVVMLVASTLLLMASVQGR